MEILRAIPVETDQKGLPVVIGCVNFLISAAYFLCSCNFSGLTLELFSRQKT